MNFEELYKSLLEMADNTGFSIAKLNADQEYPLLAFDKKSHPSKPHIYISAGIHGDEPAGPYALLELLHKNYFTEAANWYLFPLLNPFGLIHNTRTDANEVDLNRDYRYGKTKEVAAHLQWFKDNPLTFDLSIGLHEDWEMEGFYLYEAHFESDKNFGDAIINAVQEVCPIETATTIDGHKVEHGIIRPIRLNRPKKDIKNFTERDEWPEAFYLLNHNPHPHYTFETPSMRPLGNRVKAQCVAIKAVVDLFLCEPEFGIKKSES